MGAQHHTAALVCTIDSVERGAFILRARRILSPSLENIEKSFLSEQKPPSPNLIRLDLSFYISRLFLPPSCSLMYPYFRTSFVML